MSLSASSLFARSGEARGRGGRLGALGARALEGDRALGALGSLGRAPRERARRGALGLHRRELRARGARGARGGLERRGLIGDALLQRVALGAARARELIVERAELRLGALEFARGRAARALGLGALRLGLGERARGARGLGALGLERGALLGRRGRGAALGAVDEDEHVVVLGAHVVVGGALEADDHARDRRAPVAHPDHRDLGDDAVVDRAHLGGALGGPGAGQIDEEPGRRVELKDRESRGAGAADPDRRAALALLDLDRADGLGGGGLSSRGRARDPDRAERDREGGQGREARDGQCNGHIG